MKRNVFTEATPSAFSTLINSPISKVLKSKRSAKTKFIRGIRCAHRRFLAERLERQYTIRHFFGPSVPTPALIDPHLRVP